MVPFSCIACGFGGHFDFVIDIFIENVFFIFVVTVRITNYIIIIIILL